MPARRPPRSMRRAGCRRPACDAIIAQGAEAGGHRGSFLSADIRLQLGTFALVPQIADAVQVPVIAAPASRTPAASLPPWRSAPPARSSARPTCCCPEARTSVAHRAALAAVTDDDTVLTNVLTGRPARAIVNRVIRELGPMNPDAPPFPVPRPPPLAANRSAARQFAAFWSGQAAGLAWATPAEELTQTMARQTLARLTGGLACRSGRLPGRTVGQHTKALPFSVLLINTFQRRMNLNRFLILSSKQMEPRDSRPVLSAVIASDSYSKLPQGSV